LEEIIDEGIRLRRILQERQDQSNKMMIGAPIELSDSEINIFKVCYFCDEPLMYSCDLERDGRGLITQSSWGDRTVRHHSHSSFKFIGLAHDKFNLRAHFNKAQWRRNGGGQWVHDPPWNFPGGVKQCI